MSDGSGGRFHNIDTIAPAPAKPTAPTESAKPVAEPAKALTKSERAAKAEVANYSDSSGDGAPHAPSVDPPAASEARDQGVAPPTKGERVIFLGNGLAVLGIDAPERM